MVARASSLNLLVFALFLSAACSTVRTPQGGSEVRFDPGQIAKNDIDRVVEAHQRELFSGARLLMEKLYRRNPREWRRGGQPSMEAAVARVFARERDFRFAELDDKQDIAALQLAFREDFQGDRVLAFTVGLVTLFQAAFEHKREFYILDSLDAQKFYIASRNVEIAAWKLGSARNGRGEPILLSNEWDGPGVARNLSFERELGKMIGSLDLLSQILADRDGRGVVRIMQNLATAAFIPIR